jgi:hypothetical protein
MRGRQDVLYAVETLRTKFIIGEGTQEFGNENIDFSISQIRGTRG